MCIPIVNYRNKFFSICATLGPIGYLPAPGTMATALCLPGIWFALSLPLFMYVSIGVGLCMIALFLSRRACVVFKNNDPQYVVIDEVLGSWITFCALPATWHVLCIGFCVFRLLDIVKPFGIKRLEKFSQGWGVILDDVVAGILSNCVMHIFVMVGFS